MYDWSRIPFKQEYIRNREEEQTFDVLAHHFVWNFTEVTKVVKVLIDDCTDIYEWHSDNIYSRLSQAVSNSLFLG